MADIPDQSPGGNTAKKFYYLKSVPHPASPNGRYAGRYVRYTGSGHADVVLTVAHPVFLKFYHEHGKSLATFKDQVYCFKMKTSIPMDNGLRAVQIFSGGEADQGFYFDPNDGNKLKWKDEGSDPVEWAGWLLRECPPEQYKGNPQLFWASSISDKALLGGLQRIDLVAEYLP